jgi:tripartite-type tricarboxylate transporter receptor subunit TctC
LTGKKRLVPFVGAVVVALMPSLVPSFAPAQNAPAQTWPVRPVTMVVPYAAGSSVDTLARRLAVELTGRFGQQVVVENRAGANGSAGATVVARSAPDGYTILLATMGPIAANKLMYKSMPYDTDRAFTPIVLVAKSPLIIATAPKVPAKDLKELIAYAKANPGKLNVGTAGIGSQAHITLELIKKLTGTQMVHVPYNGSGQVVTDMLGGQIEMSVNFTTGYLQQILAGKIVGIAVTGADRFKELPNVPTVQESGLPGFDSTGWYALVAPTGTPPEVVDRINAAVNDYLGSAKAEPELLAIGCHPAGGTPDNLKAFIASELDKWGPVIKEANISM